MRVWLGYRVKFNPKINGKICVKPHTALKQSLLSEDYYGTSRAIVFGTVFFYQKKKMPAYCYEENLANIKHAKQQKKKKAKQKNL